MRTQDSLRLSFLGIEPYNKIRYWSEKVQYHSSRSETFYSQTLFYGPPFHNTDTPQIRRLSMPSPPLSVRLNRVTVFLLTCLQYFPFSAEDYLSYICWLRWWALYEICFDRLVIGLKTPISHILSWRKAISVLRKSGILSCRRIKFALSIIDVILLLVFSSTVAIRCFAN